jgi:integrase/recombinase XerD
MYYPFLFMYTYQVNISNFNFQKKVKKTAQLFDAEILEDYKRHLRVRNYSKRTIEGYESHFKAFLRYFNNQNIETIDSKKIELYLARFTAQSYSTINCRVCAIKLYYHEILKLDQRTFRLPKVRQNNRLPNIIDNNLIEKIFQATENIKYRCIFQFMLYGGFRVSEIVNLKLCHIDKYRNQILIKQGKGKKDRYIEYTNTMKEACREYYNFQVAKGRIPSEYLFEHDYKVEKICTRNIQIELKKVCDLLGIKDFTPHNLRHQYASNAIENNENIVKLSRKMGHGSILTTMKYIHCNPQKFEDYL